MPRSPKAVCLRIAAVQMDYLPAYHDQGFDFECEPKTLATAFGNPSATKELQDFRVVVKKEYERKLVIKLEEIVRTCSKMEADLVIFPEYSVPPSALPVLQSLSRELDLYIIAGSHRISVTDEQAEGIYKKIFKIKESENFSKRLRERAIAPIFKRGEACFIEKLTKSDGDKNLDVNSLEEPINWDNVSFPPLSARVYICSDYLKSNERLIQDVIKINKLSDSYDIVIIIANTRVMGPFASKADGDEHSSGLVKNILTSGRAHIPTILVNSAEWGGTKIYVQRMQNPNPWKLEAHDGSYGGWKQDQGQVQKVGVEAKTEGIIVGDIIKGKDGRFILEQTGVCPILHSAGPEDRLINGYHALMQKFDVLDDANAMHKFLKENLKKLEEIQSQTSNSILKEKIGKLILLASLTDAGDVLGRKDFVPFILKVCVIPDDSPSLNAWKFRATLGYLAQLRKIEQAIPSAVTEIHDIRRSLDNELEQYQKTPLPTNERKFEEEDVVNRIAPKSLIEIPAPFFELVTTETSSVRVCRNVVTEPTIK